MVEEASSLLSLPRDLEGGDLEGGDLEGGEGALLMVNATTHTLHWQWQWQWQ